MFSLFHIIKQLLVGDEEFRALLYIMAALLGTGTIFYYLVENWSIVDAFYFCVMTISTIGYGDYTPATAASKLFTIVLALAGIGVFVAIATKLGQGLTGQRMAKVSKGKATKTKDE